MEFGEMLKQGLSETPGHGFTNRMKEQVLRDVANIQPRRVQRGPRPLTFLTAAAAVAIATAAGWGVYTRTHVQSPAAPVIPASHSTNPANSGPLAPVNEPLSGPAHVSLTAGLGDTLAALQKAYGTATQVTHSTDNTATVEYAFPHGIAVWMCEGRVVEIHRAFQPSESHSAHMVMNDMTPVDSTIQGTPMNAGTTQVFTYQSPSLASFMPKTWFGGANPGEYRMEYIYPSDGSAYVKITLGDVGGYPLTFAPGQRPEQTTIAYESEGMYESEPAKLWQSSQGYNMYVLASSTASSEEPGADTVFLHANHDLSMRIQALPSNADPTKAVNQAKQQLTTIGQPVIGNPRKDVPMNDWFANALFEGSATHGASHVVIWVMHVDGRLFQFTITSPTEAESVSPFYTMISTIEVSH